MVRLELARTGSPAARVNIDPLDFPPARPCPRVLPIARGGAQGSFPNTRPLQRPWFDLPHAMRQSALLEIRTERLVLRRPRLEDVPAIVLACQDPDVPRFMPEVSTPYGEQDARRFLASVDRAWRESDERTFAIAGRDGVYLGSVSVALREGGNVGYMLSPSARGHGFMTEAVRAVVRWAHEMHGVQSLQLWTHPDNLASQAVAERAGFARLGERRCDTPFRDGSTVGILFETR